jgi:hypothetical protein
MTKTKNYLNNKDLLDEIYKSRELGELTPKGLKMLMTLAQKSIRKLYYKCEDDKQHALSEAYYDIVKNWKKFDPDFARFNGYSTLKPGDEIRVYVEKDSDRTAFATVVENYPDIEKIKLEYIVKKNETEIKIFDKSDILIKEPNAFSFFTSTCVNGFAKGWKRIYPNKSKGLLLSSDSGFDRDSEGFHSI